MGGEYLGFGPDAASDFGGRRFTAVRDVMDYFTGILNGGMVWYITDTKLQFHNSLLPKLHCGAYTE